MLTIFLESRTRKLFKFRTAEKMVRQLLLTCFRGEVNKMVSVARKSLMVKKSDFFCILPCKVKTSTVDVIATGKIIEI